MFNYSATILFADIIISNFICLLFLSCFVSVKRESSFDWKVYFNFRKKREPFMRETNNELNSRINFPRNSYLCRVYGIRKSMLSTMKWHITFTDIALGAYFLCVRETGEEDQFIRRRDSWFVQFASFERRRRDVYCTKTSDELQ